MGDAPTTYNRQITSWNTDHFGSYYRGLRAIMAELRLLQFFLRKPGRCKTRGMNSGQLHGCRLKACGPITEQIAARLTDPRLLTLCHRRRIHAHRRIGRTAKVARWVARSKRLARIYAVAGLDRIFAKRNSEIKKAKYYVARFSGISEGADTADVFRAS